MRKKSILLLAAILSLIGGGLWLGLLKSLPHAYAPALAPREDLPQASRSEVRAGEPTAVQDTVAPRPSDFAAHEQKVLEQKLLEFRRLDVLALRSRAQKADYERMLSDQAFIRDVYLFLTQANENQNIQSRVADSIVAVDFFASALRWSQNPARDELVQKINYYLVLDSYKNITEEKFRAALVGDQAELYMLLVEQAPEVARDLREHARGTHLAKVIQFTEDTYLRSKHEKPRI